MAKKAKPQNERIEVQEIKMAEVKMNVLGTSPMIMHRFSQKAWRELLFPGIRENQASLEQKLKHDPIAEFRGAVYLTSIPKSKAAIHVPNGAFHAAIASAALDVPGAKKAVIERLTSVVDINIELYGIPQLFCAMVRNSDINRTPDVRTRPIFPEWACTVNFSYMQTALTERAVANLLGAAGHIVGIGDWRPQKGGPYGKFRVVDDNHSDFNRIVKQQGRAPQLKALEQPIFFDDDSKELVVWFTEEVARREMTGKLAHNGKGRKPAKRKVFEIVGSEGDERLVNVEN